MQAGMTWHAQVGKECQVFATAAVQRQGVHGVRDNWAGARNFISLSRLTPIFT